MACSLWLVLGHQGHCPLLNVQAAGAVKAGLRSRESLLQKVWLVVLQVGAEHREAAHSAVANALLAELVEAIAVACGGA